MIAPDERKELYELIGALCNDCIMSEEHARLEWLLETNPEALQLYCNYIDVHMELGNAKARETFRLPFDQLKQELDRISAGNVPASSPKPNSDSGQSTSSTWWKGISYLLVISATVLCTLGIHKLVVPVNQPGVDRIVEIASPELPEYVATLLKSADCKWSGDHRPQFDGQRLLSRDIRLEEGLAELGFDSGVRIIVQGPAHMSIDSSSNAILHEGSVVLHGHESASPFALETPYSTLLDIGTEYGASVTEDANTEVHVFSGEVQLKPNGDASAVPEKTLFKGEAATLDKRGIVPATLNHTKFVREIPQSSLPQVPSASRLLAYEGFDYKTPTLAEASGGNGFVGNWRGNVAQNGKPASTRIYQDGSLSLADSVPRQGNALELVVGGQPSARTLETPIRLDIDAVYYVSFLMQKVADAPRGESQYLSFSFRTADFPKDPRKLHIGLTSENFPIMTHSGKEVIVAPPLVTGETYLYVAKIVAGRETPDQLMLRIYGPDEKVRDTETLIWNCVTPAELDDTVFDQLLIFSARNGHFLTDEIRIGTTWKSVTDSDPGPGLSAEGR